MVTFELYGDHDNRISSYNLTKREFEVWSLLSIGHSNKVIAKILGLSSPATVRNYQRAVYSELGISENDVFNQRVRAAVIYKQLYPFELIAELGSVDLTPTEHSILSLLAEGYSNAKISEELSLKGRVSTYLSDVYRKLGLPFQDHRDSIDRRVMAILLFNKLQK